MKTYILLFGKLTLFISFISLLIFIKKLAMGYMFEAFVASLGIMITTFTALHLIAYGKKYNYGKSANV